MSTDAVKEAGMASMPSDHVPQHNNGVDYVIRYRFGGEDGSQAARQLEMLLRRLAEVGLQCEVRQGDETSLLVFARATKRSLAKALYQSRVRDWLHGVRNTEPEPASSAAPQTEAERLRVIYHMITVAQEEGGADITPNHGEWRNVEAIFALHDQEANNRCLKEYSRKTFLSTEDLDQIRGQFGESVGFYFAFLQSYFRFLVFPALFGFSCWLLLGSFSIIYTAVNSLWCIVFVEYWKRQEVDLGCRWQSKGVSVVRTARRQFVPDKEVRDEGTGEIRGVFPAQKRMYRQLLQVPFALLSAVALGVIIATCFAIEIFISEVYSGPLKTYLIFIPTILLSALVPTMSAVLTSIATNLNEYENYETHDAYDTALTRKIFVINFITSYLPIFLTAFVYVPFASLIAPYLDVFQVAVRPFVSKEKATTHTQFSIDPDRLRKQVIYFTVTAQIVGFGMETILPFVKQNLLRKYKEYARKKNGRAENGSRPPSGNHSDSEEDGAAAVSFDDPPEEGKFLQRARNEADLSHYDVTDDLREMCIQFGYLALFSPVWPLVPVSFLVNNWVELRSDFFKIVVECRRPLALRADTIGPWLDTLGFLSWVGSITSAALLYMFSSGQAGPNGEPTAIKGWALLLSIFCAEHVYLIVRYVVRAAMSKLEPPNARRERTNDYLLRKRFLDSTLRGDGPIDAPPDTDEAQLGRGSDLSDITVRNLEDDARTSSVHLTDDTDRFWLRQKGWHESAQVGESIIRAQTSPAAKKQQ